MKFSNKCIEICMMIDVLFLLINTVCGSIWFTQYQREHEDFLKTQYFIEAIILLSIPISIAGFSVVLFFVVVCLLIMEHRRMRNRQRFEDEGGDIIEDNQQIDEIVETYMRMLDVIQFDKEASKHFDCAICLKEFDTGEKLYQIPNCGHTFHENCLRKWFRQLQICPMCRGNIIKMPNSQSSR